MTYLDSRLLKNMLKIPALGPSAPGHPGTPGFPGRPGAPVRPYRGEKCVGQTRLHEAANNVCNVLHDDGSE